MSKLVEYVGSWDRILSPILEDTEVIDNINKVNHMYTLDDLVIYPKQENVFRAFKECLYENLRVVILMQDPYHDGSATGVAMANENTKYLSPSLRIVKDTISREVYNSHDFDFDPTLLNWEKQGILMLNTALTVEKGKPLSHQDLWSTFTKKLLTRLSEINSGIIYCLWGKHAYYFSMWINPDSNTVLTANHPVYASYRGEPWECDHFNLINGQLKDFNNITINW